MTDRYSGFIVTLRNDLRSDDVEATLNALRMVKGVIDVSPIVSDCEVSVAAIRAKNEMREKLFNFIREDLA